MVPFNQFLQFVLFVNTVLLLTTNFSLLGPSVNKIDASPASLPPYSCQPEPSFMQCNGWSHPPRMPNYSILASRPSAEGTTPTMTGGEIIGNHLFILFKNVFYMFHHLTFKSSYLCHVSLYPKKKIFWEDSVISLFCSIRLLETKISVLFALKWYVQHDHYFGTCITHIDAVFMSCFFNKITLM